MLYLMDYETFDRNTDTSDKDYFFFVAWLSDRTAGELRLALASPELQRQALCRYYKRGKTANLSTEELVDFLGVSSPSIIDLAGYTEQEGNALMQISASLTDDDIDRVE